MPYPYNDKKFPLHSLKCAICRSEIHNSTKIYQSSTTLGIFCEECFRLFTSEDIELILSLFIAYGGYFGKYNGCQFSSEKIIKNLMKYFNKKIEKFNFDELNMRLLHRALLFGITPESYIKYLTSILDK